MIASAELFRAARRSGALVLLMVAMVSVQAGASFAKQLFPVLGARGTTALRIAVAALILCVVSRPWRHRLGARQWRPLIAYGVILGVMNFVFYLALERIPLGVTVALEFMGPLTVALLASRRLGDVFWALLAAAGLVAIVGRGLHAAQLDLVGVLFALAAAVCWGLYIIIGQRVGAVVPAGVATAYGMLIAACVVLPGWALGGEPMPLTSHTIGLGVLVGVLSSAVPYSLEMVALQRLPAKTFGICMSLEPAIAAVLGLLLLGEHLQLVQWLGILAVIGASAGSIAASAPSHAPATLEVTT